MTKIWDEMSANRDVAAGKIHSLGNYALDGVCLGKVWYGICASAIHWMKFVTPNTIICMKGTFSRVERATHVILKRRVALKVQNKERITNQGRGRVAIQGLWRENITELKTSVLWGCPNISVGSQNIPIMFIKRIFMHLIYNWIKLK